MPELYELTMPPNEVPLYSPGQTVSMDAAGRMHPHCFAVLQKWRIYNIQGRTAYLIKE